MRDTSFVRHVAASNWEYDDCEKSGVEGNVELHFTELVSHKILSFGDMCSDSRKNCFAILNLLDFRASIILRKRGQYSRCSIWLISVMNKGQDQVNGLKLNPIFPLLQGGTWEKGSFQKGIKVFRRQVSFHLNQELFSYQ